MRERERERERERYTELTEGLTRKNILRKNKRSLKKEWI